MQKKHVAFGTIKTVQVLSREVTRVDPHGRRLRKPAELLTLASKREPSQAYVLLGSGWHPDAQPGDTGIITFCEGGPTGGHWVFQPDAKVRTA